jgi:hypothetical protein
LFRVKAFPYEKPAIKYLGHYWKDVNIYRKMIMPGIGQNIVFSSPVEEKLTAEESGKYPFGEIGPRSSRPSPLSGIQQRLVFFE